MESVKDAVGMLQVGEESQGEASAACFLNGLAFRVLWYAKYIRELEAVIAQRHALCRSYASTLFRTSLASTCYKSCYCPRSTNLCRNSAVALFAAYVFVQLRLANEPELFLAAIAIAAHDWSVPSMAKSLLCSFCRRD